MPVILVLIIVYFRHRVIKVVALSVVMLVHYFFQLKHIKAQGRKDALQSFKIFALSSKAEMTFSEMRSKFKEII